MDNHRGQGASASPLGTRYPPSTLWPARVAGTGYPRTVLSTPMETYKSPTKQTSGLTES